MPKPEIWIMQYVGRDVALMEDGKQNGSEVDEHLQRVHHLVRKYVLHVCAWGGAQELDDCKEQSDAVRDSQELNCGDVLLVLLVDLGRES